MQCVHHCQLLLQLLLEQLLLLLNCQVLAPESSGNTAAASATTSKPYSSRIHDHTLGSTDTVQTMTRGFHGAAMCVLALKPLPAVGAQQ
jgi:hypothetical protein